MTPRLLTDEEYADLKQKLHQAHDKIIKKALQEKEGIREFSDKIVMPLLQGLKINLDNLQLDTTTYIGSNLQAFYSDVVYLTDLIDETAQTQEPIHEVQGRLSFFLPSASCGSDEGASCDFSQLAGSGICGDAGCRSLRGRRRDLSREGFRDVAAHCRAQTAGRGTERR